MSAAASTACGERAAERRVRRLRCRQQHLERKLVQQLRSRRSRRARSKRAGTFASNGNRCSSCVQKAWMVCTFSPPGVSSASANNCRARARRCASIVLTPILRMALVERFVVERRPGAQILEHFVGHIGGGGLGEGDAEDACRIDTRQQQPDHALGEHMRLAGAGIGGDPGREIRVGSERLPLDHRAWDIARRAHSPPRRHRRRRSATTPSRARDDRSRRSGFRPHRMQQRDNRASWDRRISPARW